MLLSEHEQETERVYRSFIEDKMEARREENMDILASAVRKDIVEDFARALVSAVQFECPHAKKLASWLGFDDLDFFSIEEDLEGYIKEYEAQQERGRDYEHDE